LDGSQNNDEMKDLYREDQVSITPKKEENVILSKMWMTKPSQKR